VNLHGTEIAVRASQFLGIPYKWGGKDLKGWDCSGFVSYVLEDMGYNSDFPDGSYNQYGYCYDRGTIIPVAMAMVLSGALLFRRHSRSHNIVHVGISVGYGMGTLEAYSKQAGTVKMPYRTSWTTAAMIPDIFYRDRLSLKEMLKSYKDGE